MKRKRKRKMERKHAFAVGALDIGPALATPSGTCRDTLSTIDV
jgi:hypothetical protein